MGKHAQPEVQERHPGGTTSTQREQIEPGVSPLAPHAPSRTCWICANANGNRGFIAVEMMFGTREPFAYRECARRGTIWIAEVPENLGRYYPDGYYSLSPPAESAPKRLARRARARHALGRRTPWGALLVHRYGEPEYAEWVRRAGAGLGSRILDVGSGGGRLVADLRNAGFVDVLGIDPFLARDMDLGNGARILKRTLDQIEGRYDLIMLHHSLEHVPDPRGTLLRARELLAPGGTILVRTPVSDCYAWRVYGPAWVQLDPPRHLFVPSVDGLRDLAREIGLETTAVVHDSTEFQFWGSEQYLRGIPLRDERSYAENPERSPFTEREIESWKRRARELNAAGDGDQACFYFQAARSS